MKTRTYMYTVTYKNGDIDETKFAFTSDSKIYAIVRGVAKKWHEQKALILYD